MLSIEGYLLVPTSYLVHGTVITYSDSIVIQIPKESFWLHPRDSERLKICSHGKEHINDYSC